MLVGVQSKGLFVSPGGNFSSACVIQVHQSIPPLLPQQLVLLAPPIHDQTTGIIPVPAAADLTAGSTSEAGCFDKSFCPVVADSETNAGTSGWDPLPTFLWRLVSLELVEDSSALCHLPGSSWHPCCHPPQCPCCLHWCF